MILYEASHFKAKLREDGASFSTLDPDNKLVAKTLIFIEEHQTAEQVEEEKSVDENE